MATHVASGERMPLTQVYQMVRGMIEVGKSDDAIVAELGAQGMAHDQAATIVHSVHSQVGGSVSSRPITAQGSGNILLAAMLGAGAAVISGIVWGLIAITTQHEIGFVAWGVGLLCGLAVFYGSGREGGAALQAVAVIASLAGIAIGKYIGFVAALKALVTEEVGPEVAVQVTYFSSKVFASLVENLGGVFGLYDLLWIALAVSTAFKLNAKRP
ncbi:MAG: hypothetical protein IT350_20475 [Deltaproteobacteria bacterium]|nr:hypothetical protein [Deltaproteobacteria bacterium]